ncbi:MAG: hypothetical protein GKS06_03070 [Acidobacteria bacterium]|nr:hypothetical protein [Acidobacteriota bacterium]
MESRRYEIFYSARGFVMGVRYDAETGSPTSTPEPVFPLDWALTGFDIDGEGRFIVQQVPDEGLTEPERLMPIVIENWQTLLER